MCSPFCKRISFLFPPALSVIVCFTAADIASAQTGSLFGNQGPISQIGSNSGGTSLSSGTAFGRSTGTGGLGGTQLGGTQLGGAQGGGTQAGTQGGFVGRNDNAGRFVGDQRLGQQSQQQGGGGRGSSNFGNRTGGGTGRAFGGGTFGGGNQQSRRIIRTRQVVAFSFPQRQYAAINSSLNVQFRRLALGHSRMQGVLVAVDEQGVATLSGQVDSLQTSKLAATIARLEPGIRSVQNELTVKETSSSASE